MGPILLGVSRREVHCIAFLYLKYVVLDICTLEVGFFILADLLLYGPRIGHSSIIPQLDRSK